MRRIVRALACIGGAAAMIVPTAAAQAQTPTVTPTPTPTPTPTSAPTQPEEACKVAVTRLNASRTAIRATVERTGCEEPTILRAELRFERFGPDRVVRRAKRTLRPDGALNLAVRCTQRTRSFYVVVTDSDGNFAKSEPVRLRCGSTAGFDDRAGSGGNNNGSGGNGNGGGTGGSGNSGGGSTAVGTAAEQEVIRLTNQHRQAAGCSALTPDAALRTAALGHSKRMAAQNRMEHQLPGEPSFVERIKAAGFSPLSAAAENIAAGHPNAKAVVDAWMKSSGHRANILNCNLTHIGVGVAQGSGGKLFWTQNFARH